MEQTKARSIIEGVLKWYARHMRDLPWRQSYSPYTVWLSEIMLQQTTVPHATPYFLKFIEKYPTVQALAAADNAELMSDWAGLGYYSRARNLHKAAKIVAEKGAFPDDFKGLKALPGVGDYTAGAIMALAYNQRANVVDGNIERIVARLCAVTTPLPQAKPILKKLAATMFLDEANIAPRDLPQAFMDLATVICTPTNPKCGVCPIGASCLAFEMGLQNNLPARQKKQPRPKRRGFAYVITNDDGQILLERRAESGLLGGMVGLPTSEWVDAAGKDAPKHLGFIEKMQDIGQIRHVFTHFELTLDVFKAKVTNVPEGCFWQNNIHGLPSVFNKAYKLAA